MKAFVLLFLNSWMVSFGLAQTVADTQPPKQMFGETYSISVKLTHVKSVDGSIYALNDSVVWVLPIKILFATRLDQIRKPVAVPVDRIKSGTVTTMPLSTGLFSEMPQVLGRIRTPDPLAWQRLFRTLIDEAKTDPLPTTSSQQTYRSRSIRGLLPDSVRIHPSDLGFGVSLLPNSVRAEKFRGVNYHRIIVHTKKGPNYQDCLYALTDTSLILADREALRHHLRRNGPLPAFYQVPVDNIRDLRVLEVNRGASFALGVLTRTGNPAFPFRSRANTSARARVSGAATAGWWMELESYSVLGQAGK